MARSSSWLILSTLLIMAVHGTARTMPTGSCNAGDGTTALATEATTPINGRGLQHLDDEKSLPPIRAGIGAGMGAGMGVIGGLGGMGTGFGIGGGIGMGTGSGSGSGSGLGGSGFGGTSIPIGGSGGGSSGTDDDSPLPFP